MLIRILVPVYYFLMLSLPAVVAGLPFVVADGTAFRLCAIAAAPILYLLAFLVCCGLLSWPHRWAIQNGRFQRSLDDRVYGRRRLHALCWTAIYYSPFYPFYLAFPTWKRILFRLFGYRGSLEFTAYPDTWIRDLPVLQIGRGAYLSNKSTIGTNLALQDGRILVDGITIGEGAMVGHLTMVAAGTTLGDGAEVSHGTACGVRVTLGKGAAVNPDCCIDHHADIGEEADVGTRSYVGLGARIGSKIKLPPGSNIPRRAKLVNQADVECYLSSETKDLHFLRAELARRIQQDTHTAE